MQAADAIRVLVADDNTAARPGLAARLCADDDVALVGSAGTGRELLEKHARAYPDVTVVRFGNSGEQTLRAIRAIRKQAPAARFVVIAPREDEEYVFRTFRAGAQGYLLDCATSAELLRAVRDVASGHSYVPLPVAASLARHLASPPDAASHPH